MLCPTKLRQHASRNRLTEFHLRKLVTALQKYNLFYIIQKTSRNIKFTAIFREIRNEKIRQLLYS